MLLLNHPFPGNVRELLNLIEQAVIMCRNNQINLENLPPSLVEASMRADLTEKRDHHKQKIDSQTLHELFVRYHGNRNAVAHELGVDRTTLWRWMKRYGIVESELR